MSLDQILGNEKCIKALQILRESASPGKRDSLQTIVEDNNNTRTTPSMQLPAGSKIHQEATTTIRANGALFSALHKPTLKPL